MPRQITLAPNVLHGVFNALVKDGQCFVQIPKVGSTTVRKILRYREGWEPLKTKRVDAGLQFLALVRHPVARWISGMAQWMASGQRGKETTETALQRMRFDVHTSKQADWVEGVTPLLFKLEHISLMWRYLGLPNRTHENKRRGPTLVFDAGQEAEVLAYYADDLKLWKQAQ